MSKSSGLHAFVINLDRSPERMEKMRERLAPLPLSWERVPAVEGKLLDLADHPEVCVSGYRQWHGKDLNPAEAGCYLSHIAVLRRFLEGPWQYALVLEDDADFPPDFMPLLQSLLAQEASWDVVKLSGFHRGTPIKLGPLHGKYSLAVPLSRLCNSNSLLIHRRAAERLLRGLLPMRLPYDHALERAWLWGLKLRMVTPLPCPADTGVGTTIGTSTTMRRFKLPAHRRLPAYMFRLRTELGRAGFGLMHVINARLKPRQI